MPAALRLTGLRVWAAALILIPLLPGAAEATTWTSTVGDACVVRSHGSALVEEVLARCEAAAPVVERYWPGWDARVTVVVADSVAELSRLVPGTGPLEDVAGIATETVYVNPEAYLTLSPAGRQVVLTHEVGHVATREGRGVPTWLAEGFAEAVAHADGAIPLEVAAQELAAEVRRGHVPEALPDDGVFGRENVASHYEQAWRAVALIAQTYGWDALRRFYRAGGDFAALGTTQQTFTRAWRADLLRTFS